MAAMETKLTKIERRRVRRLLRKTWRWRQEYGELETDRYGRKT